MAQQTTGGPGPPERLPDPLDKIQPDEPLDDEDVEEAWERQAPMDGSAPSG